MRQSTPRSFDNIVTMPVRNVALLLCGLLNVGLCQNPTGILVEGISERGPDWAPSASELALLPQRTITVTDHGTPVTFQGVLLTDVLGKVATPTGEKFHKTAASYFVVAEGKDG